MFGALILGGLASGAFRQFGLMVPSLGGNPFAELPLDAVFPLGAVVLVAVSFDRSRGSASVSAARRIGRWLGLWQLAGIVLFSLASMVGSLTGLNLTSTRNALAYLALVQIGQLTRLRRHAAVVPALALFLGTAFGRAGSTELQIWAWPLMDAGVVDTAAWLAVVCITTLTTRIRLN